MGKKLRLDERAMIDAAVDAGLVRRVGRVSRCVSSHAVSSLPLTGAPMRRDPPDRPRAVPERLDVRSALEWAFAVEHAQLDYDEIGASSGGQRPGRSVEAVIAERARLGAVSIDTSPGRSLPADEADIIASVLRSVLPWRDACWLAELARARRAPPLLDGVRACFSPREWVHGRGGARGRTADVMAPGVASSLGLAPRGGWPMGAGARRNRRGAVVRDPIMVTPVSVAPTADQVAAARRAWLAWWDRLLEVRRALGGRVGRIVITDDMPPLSPWRGRG